MQDFLKEWGPAVVTALVILILIAMIKAVAPMIKLGVLGTLTKWSGIVDSMTNNNGEFPEEKEYGVDITLNSYFSNNVDKIDKPAFKTSGDVVIPGEIKMSNSGGYMGDGLWHKIKKIDTCFYGCTEITSITIEDGVEEILCNAFQGNSGLINLTSVTMADSITRIEGTAFYGCPKLESVQLSNNLEYIGSQAFSNTGLKSITIPASVKTMDSQTFYTCNNLEKVIFEGATNISHGCFYSCRNLKSVTLGEGTTQIGSQAFMGCTNLDTIEIPDSVTSIDSSAFRKSGLSSVRYKNITYTSKSALTNALESNGVSISSYDNPFNSTNLTD